MTVRDDLPPERSRLLTSLPWYSFFPAPPIPIQSKVQQLLLFLSRPYGYFPTLPVRLDLLC